MANDPCARLSNAGGGGNRDGRTASIGSSVSHRAKKPLEQAGRYVIGPSALIAPALEVAEGEQMILETPARVLLDAGLHPLEIVVGHVVDGRLREFDRELPRARRVGRKRSIPEYRDAR